MPLIGDYAPSTAGWARRQAERYEATNGLEAGDLRGRPIVVLTSVGARTGKLRKTALMRVEHDGLYAVVASLGGAPRHPVWYYNLKAHPRVELQDGPMKRDYAAREVSGDEKALWWARAVEAWPDYARYQGKTARQIPVFVDGRAELYGEAFDMAFYRAMQLKDVNGLLDILDKWNIDAVLLTPSTPAVGPCG